MKNVALQIEQVLVLTVPVLLIGLAILCAVGCSTSESINLTLPTECTASYSPSIGKDLVVGESSEELLRKVGEPNQAIKHKGYTYYVYYVQPYLLRETGGEYLGVCRSEAYQDSSVYLVSFDADKKIESVVYILSAGADSQRVRVPGADGLMLPATLYRPRGCGTSREPAIVLLHGWLISWRDVEDDPSSLVPVLFHGERIYKEGTDVGLEFFAQLLAEHGYVVLLPVMRPWGGGSQNDCGLSQSADTKRMIEWLASQPGVDPDRIGVMGGSFGGQVALLTGALTPRVKAIISVAGPTDWASMNAQVPWPWHWARLNALVPWYPKECLSDLESRSPVSVASRIKAPVLLIQGDADTNVPPEQAEEMEQALRKSGDSVQLHLVSGAGHDDSEFMLPWPTTQEFLEANLGKPSCVQTLRAPSASAQPTPRALESQ
jgi:dienelactone hydrolase